MKFRTKKKRGKPTHRNPVRRPPSGSPWPAAGRRHRPGRGLAAPGRGLAAHGRARLAAAWPRAPGPRAPGRARLATLARERERERGVLREGEREREREIVEMNPLSPTFLFYFIYKI